jgi:hypothetical protein
MTLAEYQLALLGVSSSAEILAFCQNRLIHGTPYIFKNREGALFDFKQRICGHFNVHHTTIFIVGSAKLGFSPFKSTAFSAESDVDVAIVSPDLVMKVDRYIQNLQYAIRSSSVNLSLRQNGSYHKFLEYRAMGWVRPDKIPNAPPTSQFKEDWFDFFTSISYGKSEVGDFKVSAGVFLSQQHLERYCLETAEKTQLRLRIEKTKENA